MFVQKTNYHEIFSLEYFEKIAVMFVLLRRKQFMRLQLEDDVKISYKKHNEILLRKDTFIDILLRPEGSSSYGIRGIENKY